MSEKIRVEVDEELEEFVPDYLQAREKDYEAIHRFVKEGNFEQIQALGHKMKGSGGGYGFDYITECGKYIEQSAKDKSVEDIKVWVENLSEYLKKLEIVYVEMDD
ncbi:MAG: Hpt domain-containing protein [Deltaproteobacteria bacterium]|nr:Hpt domain-containing protein [Deltaproteobacteria bacterium]